MNIGHWAKFLHFGHIKITLRSFEAAAGLTAASVLSESGNFRDYT
jgi:hypothetical protein